MTTIPADHLFMVVVGLLFSWSCAVQIERSRSVFLNRYFLGALAFQTLFCMPLAVYCYVVFPDWCWMYWIDSRTVPAALVIAAFADYYVWMTAGFALGFYAERRETGLGWKVLRTAFLVLLAFCALTYRRLFFVGSLAEFSSGAIPSLLGRPLLFGLLIIGFGLAFFALVLILSRFGRELDRPWSAEDQARFERRRRVVSLTRVESDLPEALGRSLDAWDGISLLGRLLADKGPRIILKPNFSGGGKDKQGTQTSPEVIEAVIDLIRQVDPGVEILIAESGSIFWWDVGRLLEGSVYQGLLSAKGVRFVDLSRAERIWHDFGGRMGREEVPAILTEPHVLIDLPVAKTHSFYRMSGAMKNLFGLTPVPVKLFRYHTKGFADARGRIFIDIYRSFPPDLVILDGTVSCAGSGPNGRPKRTDFLMTSDDALCADLLLARIMGMEPAEVPYLKVLLDEGLEPEFDLVGEPIERVRPATWEKPMRWGGGLALNFLGIAGEHLKDRLRRMNHTVGAK